MRAAPLISPSRQTGFEPLERVAAIAPTASNRVLCDEGGGEGRGKMPYRLSIRSPMFITIPFVAKTMIGYKVADIPAIMGSFDPCIGETDR